MMQNIPDNVSTNRKTQDCFFVELVVKTLIFTPLLFSLMIFTFSTNTELKERMLVDYQKYKLTESRVYSSLTDVNDLTILDFERESDSVCRSKELEEQCFDYFKMKNKFIERNSTSIAWFSLILFVLLCYLYRRYATK